MRFFHRQLLRGVLGVVAWPRLTLAVCGLVLAGSVALAATRLTISTDQNKLFSSDVRFFRNYLRFIREFPENEAIYVVVQPLDAAHPPPVRRWTALADEITQRLRGLGQHVRSVDSRVPIDQLGAQGLLFEDPARLSQTVQEAQQFVPLVRLWAERPNLLTGLLGNTPLERFLGGAALQQPDQQSAQFLALLARSWTAALDRPDDPLRPGSTLPDLGELDADDPSRLGYYYVPDERDPSRHLLLVRVYQRSDFSSLTAISGTVGEIRRAAVQAAAGFPEFRVGVTGRPALEADEMFTTDRDSHRAETAALVVIFIAMVVMLRSVWLALVAELALGVGIGWTFGYATLAVGELNLLSIVFLIALIGIGMDYLVQVLTRYRREALRHSRPGAVWVAVFRHIAAPINTACLGAAGAFLVSALTRFRGAADLGIIAGGGLLLCLLSGYTVLPALLVLFPPKRKDIRRPSGGVPPTPRGLSRLLLPALWIGALAAGIPFARRVHFDPGLIDLQAPGLESVQLVRALKTWSAVVLSSDPDVLRQARDSLNGAPTVAGTESILSAYDNYEWLRAHPLPAIEWTEPQPVTPDDLSKIATKAEALAAQYQAATSQPKPGGTQAGTGDAGTLTETAALLRDFARRLRTATDSAPQRQVAQRLSAWQSAFVAQLRELMQQFSPLPPEPAKLPVELRSHLVSAEGTYALYVLPREDLWEREKLTAFVTEVETRVGKVPGHPIVTGIASNIYHSTGSIQRSFYQSTAYALSLIFLLVLIDLRRVSQTLMAVSVLALGLPMLVALMGLLGLSWNFANFFGLPILIGAGHEYGVFMIHRYREARRDPRRFWKRWDVSDRALLLCAFITCSSFAFFWALGHHEGLRSLGLVMALGSACIYVATIMVLRPLLKWRLDAAARRDRSRAQDADRANS